MKTVMSNGYNNKVGKLKEKAVINSKHTKKQTSDASQS